ncbi:MAG: hypothetical protein BM556_00335 [Bacteriovorax sp. MedPE-SWde]|nr:MAG: hypothetical protein BM556_00335 [Bacteriovorax sp. MedPE-SWde]
MKSIIISLFSLFILTSVEARVPRQQIMLKGNYNKDIKKTFSVDFLNKFKLKKIKINDPYQNNKELEFEGISLAQVFDKLGPKAKSLDVTAVNLYKIKFDRNHPRAKSTYFVFKENGKYINVDKMGPLRIIRDVKGKISTTELALEGVEWVWMVKELKFE